MKQNSDNSKASIENRKKGGGKLSRSETVSVRLEPRLRYLAELAARKQRRTLSSFIEWSIEETLKRECISESDNGLSPSFWDVSNWLWDVDDADRFAKLCLRYPELLTHDEQICWKLIRENGFLWHGKFKFGVWEWAVNEASLNLQRLREHWNVFRGVSVGELDSDALPKWTEYELSDDIVPF